MQYFIKCPKCGKNEDPLMVSINICTHKMSTLKTERQDYVRDNLPRPHLIATRIMYTVEYLADKLLWPLTLLAIVGMLLIVWDVRHGVQSPLDIMTSIYALPSTILVIMTLVYIVINGVYRFLMDKQIDRLLNEWDDEHPEFLQTVLRAPITENTTYSGNALHKWISRGFNAGI